MPRITVPQSMCKRSAFLCTASSNRNSSNSPQQITLLTWQATPGRMQLLWSRLTCRFPWPGIYGSDVEGAHFGAFDNEKIAARPGCKWRGLRAAREGLILLLFSLFFFRLAWWTRQLRSTWAQPRLPLPGITPVLRLARPYSLLCGPGSWNYTTTTLPSQGRVTVQNCTSF